MQRATQLLFYCIVLLCCKFAAAQSPAYKHFDVSDGLPTNEVYEIKQDNKGFLWIGCDAGLVRYDGNKFRLLTNKKNRGPAITCLREDKQGRIWCANFSGQIFFTSGDSLQLFEPWEKNYKSNFAEIAIDNNNFLYVTNFQNKLFRYDLENNQEKIVVDNNETKLLVFTAFDGSVLFTSLDAGQVKKITASLPEAVTGLNNDYSVTNNFVFYNSLKNKHTLAFQRYSAANPQTSLFFYENGKLVEHPATPVLKKLNVNISSCFYDDEGNLFIGTYNELLWLKKSASGAWFLFNVSLQGNGISYIQQDKEGSIWISTLKNGLFKITNKDVWEVTAKMLNLKSTGINHLTTDGAATIYGAATNGDIFAFNTKTKVASMVSNPELRDAQALDYNSYSKELFISKSTTYIFSPGSKKGYSLNGVSTNAKDFYFTKNGSVFNSGSGINAIVNANNIQAKEKLVKEYDTICLAQYNYKLAGKERITISTQRCKGVWYQEQENTLWGGYVDGLVYYQDKMPIKFIDPKTAQPLIATGFDEAVDGIMYVATVEQGVYAIKNKKITAHYTVSNGLLSNRIKRIHVANNTLWIICGGAVQALQIQTGKIKTINTTDGLNSSEIFDVEVLHDTVYVASAGGLQFFPASIETKNQVYPVSIISSIEADDVFFSTSEKVELAYNTKNIVINLQGIALKSDGQFTFQYRLLPSEKNWISVSANENIVRFSSLSSGSYVFESRVLNEDGVVSKDKSELRFTIKKPWWFQWWFLALAFVTVTVLLYWLFKNRLKVNQQKLKQELEKSKVQEELRQSQLVSLKAQMNPHFMFNALNSIQEFILTNEKRQANMYMGKFADLMRMTLDMSSKKEIGLDDEIKILELYLQLEALRFEEHFNYTIEVKDEVHTADVKLPSMLIQPYVENAIKHGLLHIPGEKELSVVFDIDKTATLSCTITDNGIGRKRSGEINQMRQNRYTSFATGATQKRLELLNYERNAAIAVVYTDLVDANGNAAGTSVSIKIPV